jgi:vancomycin permeability regulator SanA
MNGEKPEERLGSSWAKRWDRLPWVVRKLPMAVLVLVILLSIPFAWTRVQASSHQYDESKVTGNADVVLVLGTEVAPGGTEPKERLRGRLDTAAQLVRAGRAKVILVSGDAGGASGNETSVMSAYLKRAGIEPNRIVTDPFGLDTYDSCLRAKTVYGVSRVLVVTQSYHLPRAVTLCRHVGLDADGVRARCDGCRLIDAPRNWFREYLACSKAAWDAYRNRPPAIQTPASSEITEALASLQ